MSGDRPMTSAPPAGQRAGGGGFAWSQDRLREARDYAGVLFGQLSPNPSPVDVARWQAASTVFGPGAPARSAGGARQSSRTSVEPSRTRLSGTDHASSEALDRRTWIGELFCSGQAAAGPAAGIGEVPVRALPQDVGIDPREGRPVPGGPRADDRAPGDPLGDFARADRVPALWTVHARRAGIFGGTPYSPGSPKACAAGAWTFRSVSRATGEVGLSPFRCKSWRCPRCAPRVNARDAARIETALSGIDLSRVLFLTLTFDPRRWRDAGEAWRHSRDCWKRLRDRLAYRYGLGRGRERQAARILYVQTWEQHKNGWPHVHALVYCESMADDVRRRGAFWKASELRHVHRWQKQVLQREAVASGFGWRCDVDFPRKDRGAVAGYLVKLASELTRSDAKSDQAPVNAPKGFRRLRSTPRFLEPIAGKSEAFLDQSGELVSLWSGAIVTAPIELLELALEIARDHGPERLGESLRWAIRELEKVPWLRPRSVPNAG